MAMETVSWDGAGAPAGALATDRWRRPNTLIAVMFVMEIVDTGTLMAVAVPVRNAACTLGVNEDTV